MSALFGSANKQINKKKKNQSICNTHNKQWRRCTTSILFSGGASSRVHSYWSSSYPRNPPCRVSLFRIAAHHPDSWIPSAWPDVMTHQYRASSPRVRTLPSTPPSRPVSHSHFRTKSLILKFLWPYSGILAGGGPQGDGNHWWCPGTVQYNSEERVRHVGCPLPSGFRLVWEQPGRGDAHQDRLPVYWAASAHWAERFQRDRFDMCAVSG